VDGSPYELSPGDDADADTYKSLGRPVTLRALCEAMITTSSNLAANLLIERLGPTNIQATVDRLGAPGMHVLRGVEDQKAFDAGRNNTTDALSLLTLLQGIGRGQVISPAASAEMVDILKRQRLNDGIPAGLPPGTVVAHKTGSITKVQHDAAIVYSAHPYVLVVLVNGIEDEHVSHKLIADIARAVHKLG
jgi:beta-lactamase class A